MSQHTNPIFLAFFFSVRPDGPPPLWPTGEINIHTPPHCCTPRPPWRTLLLLLYWFPSARSLPPWAHPNESDLQLGSCTSRYSMHSATTAVPEFDGTRWNRNGLSSPTLLTPKRIDDRRTVLPWSLMVERAPTGATLRHGRFGQQKRSDHQRDEITQFHSRRSSGPPSAPSDPGKCVVRPGGFSGGVAIRDNRQPSPLGVGTTETAASDFFGGAAALSGLRLPPPQSCVYEINTCCRNWKWLRRDSFAENHGFKGSPIHSFMWIIYFYLFVVIWKMQVSYNLSISIISIIHVILFM